MPPHWSQTLVSMPNSNLPLPPRLHLANAAIGILRIELSGGIGNLPMLLIGIAGLDYDEVSMLALPWPSPLPAGSPIRPLVRVENNSPVSV